MWSENLEILNPYENIKVLRTTKDSTLCHCGKLQNGDSFVVKYDKNYNVGDYYHNKHFIIVKIFYQPKPWWKFWQKKEILGYLVEFKGED